MNSCRGFLTEDFYSDTCIYCTNVLLVPYEEKHVERYHEWMKSEELQYLTGSEPLTLEEEYEMQKSWVADKKKCTFIILDKKTFVETRDEVVSMIGDTNLYFNEPDNHIAECEIMIAEEKARGHKLGRQAIIAMLYYGIKELGVLKYTAKIKIDNEISIKMFTKLGFVEISRSKYFQEITFEKCITGKWSDWLQTETSCQISKYIKNQSIC